MNYEPKQFAEKYKLALDSAAKTSLPVV